VTSYAGLFLSAFLAATVLPFYSEVTLGYLYYADPGAWITLLLIATAGNTLGSAVNAAMGRGLVHFQDRRWFPFKPDQIERAQVQFNRYGIWTLLLAWLPVIGDPLTLIAGTMRVKWLPFFILVFIGKGVRYALVLAVLP
tara:strand:+ start:2034 stop:2453 length:420 start_codon:yes stop_codon:yes gene_type:complete